MEELLILLVSKDSITDYISNYLLMDGHYIDVAENLLHNPVVLREPVNSIGKVFF